MWSQLRNSMVPAERGLYRCTLSCGVSECRCLFHYPSQAYIRAIRYDDCEYSPMEVQMCLEDVSDCIVPAERGVYKCTLECTDSKWGRCYFFYRNERYIEITRSSTCPYSAKEVQGGLKQACPYR